MPTFLVKSGDETDPHAATAGTCSAPACRRRRWSPARSSSTPSRTGSPRSARSSPTIRWGHAFQSSIEAAVRRCRRDRAPSRGRSRSRAGLHDLPARHRRVRARSARRHRPSAGRWPDHRPVERPRHGSAGDRRLLAVGAGDGRCRRRRSRPLRRLRLRRLPERRVPGAGPPLPRAVVRQHVHGRRRGGRLRDRHDDRRRRSPRSATIRPRSASGCTRKSSTCPATRSDELDRVG